MPITLVRQSWPMQINLDLWNVPYMYMWWWNYWKWPMCHNNNWHTLWFGSTFFDKRHTVSACHLTIFKCQPRQAGFPTVLEWPLCALWYVFCFVSSFFSTSEYALRLFLICQLIWPGHGHFCGLPVISFTKPDIFFQLENFCQTFGPALWCSDCLTNFNSTVTYMYTNCVRHPVCIHKNRWILSTGIGFPKKKMYLCMHTC